MLTFKQFNETIDRLEDARILLAALEFEVFSVIDNRSLTAREVARKTKTHLEGMQCLLNALVALKAMRFKNGKYSNTREMYKHFAESSPHYKKGTAFLKSEKNDEWAHLIRTIKKGRDLKAFEGGDDPKFRYLFTHAMHERSIAHADYISEIICKKSIGRFLDLGGGPGSYCAAVLKKDSKAEATLLDRPSAIKVAKELFGKSKFMNRFNFIKGDLFETDFGTDYDTIFFSNILHIYNPDQNKILFRKMKKSLNPGGRLVLVDYYLNKDGTGPYEAALFSLTMLLFTATGKTYTFEETEKMLKQTGFHKFKRIPLEEGTGMLVALRK